jgi:hypothetical protein
MRTRWALASLGLFVVLAAAPATAGDQETTPPIRPGALSRPLKLGLYGRITPPQSALALPRFEDSIEVTAEAPRDYNETMAVFWQQWNLSTGSIYGKGINFTNQGCPTCVNILPLIEKVIDKIKKKSD